MAALLVLVALAGAVEMWLPPLWLRPDAIVLASLVLVRWGEPERACWLGVLAALWGAVWGSDWSALSVVVYGLAGLALAAGPLAAAGVAGAACLVLHGPASGWLGTAVCTGLLAPGVSMLADDFRPGLAVGRLNV
ncbi:MAG: hypothetical protein KC910_15675 [Candidatus Eremiobacteraeota bacterium]|nr:hypothetical protein [Candidatus Eremiobacteraeota bacterium]